MEKGKSMKKLFSGRVGALTLCVAEILMGILLLVNPVGFTSAIVIGAGVVMLVAGIVFATLYFVGDAQTMALKQMLFKGMLLMIAGFLCVTKYDTLLKAFPLLTWVYAIAMLVLAAYKLQCTVDIVRLSGIRWYVPAISAALAFLLAMFILLNPYGATQIVWGFLGVSLILEAGLEIATIFMVK